VEKPIKSINADKVAQLNRPTVLQSELQKVNAEYEKFSEACPGGLLLTEIVEG